MRHIETSIILKLIAYYSGYAPHTENGLEKEINALLEKMRNDEFSLISSDFIQYYYVGLYCRQRKIVWYAILTYLNEKNVEEKNKQLKNIDSLLSTLLHSAYSDNDCATYINRKDELYHPILIKNIYLSNDDKLIDLFKRSLPAPPFRLFEANKIPLKIAENESANTRVILDYLKYSSLKTLEEKVCLLQRKFRSKKRLSEELTRIPAIYKKSVDLHKSTHPTDSIKKIIKLGSIAYFPNHCGTLLAARIYLAAHKVKLLSDIRHLTAASNFASILDDGLYGRKTLRKLYMLFSPTALAGCDIKDGDENAICFGLKQIDSRQNGEIILDYSKIESDNPAIFYKQRDFNYHFEKIRDVNIGHYKLRFSQTHHPKYKNNNKNDECFNLQIFDVNGKQINYIELPKYLFISYNLKDIHAILTLNFFRLLDSSFSYSQVIVEDIYMALAGLNSNELVNVLQEIGKAISDSAEFNFYGAHLINVASIRSIGIKDGYRVDFAALVDTLKNGDLTLFKQAKEHLPTLFASYRFLDFLISHVTSEDIKKDILVLRQACKLPEWLKQNEKTIESASSLNTELQVQNSPH